MHEKLIKDIGDMFLLPFYSKVVVYYIQTHTITI